ncbi:RNA-directed DNA polymerase [Pseudodesulfovibrio profundus]|uniref:RNA-directed DNA polymerase n=1 Tax=Pseudodesulfovibrio profundus TaxID=57320 RepID=A0A2C8F7C3_9BACT|nr:reverse transcriptase family protein [Pseudodesulfovibrio profundus]SOB57933.1 RNA-directed DNA polymerase [Pseudodesulfovibrio profundus]
MEEWSVHQFQQGAIAASAPCVDDLVRYARLLKNNGLPVIFSLGHLCKITRSNYKFLHNIVNRKVDSQNYRLFPIKKRSGGIRHIHAVAGKLYKVHDYINNDILQSCSPHPSSYAFHRSGGIFKCAKQHCESRWIFQFDLKDFFYSISEAMVFTALKNLGYKKLLAFELARICTTRHLPANKIRYTARFSKSLPSYYNNKPYRETYHHGVLPQGAPSSPMLSNLVALRLDETLSAYADENGLTYTRYADDITLSTLALPSKVSVGGIKRAVIKIIRRAGFIENPKKIRVAGPGSRKTVLGLLVDQSSPRISRHTYKRIDRLLYSISQYKLAGVAEHDGFDSSFGLYNHLHGLINYVKDVDYSRWEEFSKQFQPIKEQFESEFDVSNTAQFMLSST